MRLGKAVRAGVLLLVALGPFLLAATASPPDGPHAALPAVDEVPPLPDDGNEADLAADRFTLPLLVEDLPDGPSRAALRTYRAAGILEPDAVQAAFEAAVAALVVDEAAQPALAGLTPCSTRRPGWPAWTTPSPTRWPGTTRTAIA